MNKLNILILHRLGDPRLTREAVRSLELMIPECFPYHKSVAHDAHMPFPKSLKQIDYDLIILGPTFLCARYDCRILKRTLSEYSFIKDSQACKVALPQDDYDCCAILDRWMVDWKISRIYTVCSQDWDVLYPLSSSCADIRLGYTAYISEDWISRWEFPAAMSSRPIDVSYRASRLPANFGKLGLLKWQIAHRFKNAIPPIADLVLDISTAPRDAIPGVAWHSFLESSKFCLATPSGSSLMDPENCIRTCVRGFLNAHPQASFEEIEKQCFPGADGRHVFSAISPRNIEAALAGTVQIATPGDYSGLMKAMEHYIPLCEDCSNINEVLSMMRDRPLVKRIASQCKELILAEPRLRRLNMAAEIVDYAAEFRAQHGPCYIAPCVDSSFYLGNRSNTQKASDFFWARRRVAKRMKAIAISSFLRIARSYRGFLLHFWMR